jgi:hypothetical protein
VISGDYFHISVATFVSLGFAVVSQLVAVGMFVNL